MTLFAQTMTDVPAAVSGGWIWGFVGVAVALGSVLFTWNQAKKAFGRVPALHEEYEARAKDLRGEIYHAKNSAIKDMNARFDPLAARVVKLEEQYEEMQMDRIRKWDQLQREMSSLQRDLAFIRGKFEREDKRP